jgi:TIR domain
VRLLKPVFNSDYTSQKTICRRAHAGLIRARAEHFMVDDQSKDGVELPKDFWWAEDGAALEQNWTTGDFTTWIQKTTRLRAFGVSFLRADIKKLIPVASGPAERPKERQDPAEGRRTKWNVFISHASEDKDDFVRPLADSLRNSGLRVWYDDFTLTVGDSLRRSIDRGLAESRYGIVVISPNFLKKEWPQKELDGLAAREVDGEKEILPVWHDIRADEVRAHSPTLADRMAALSSRGIDKVAKELLQAIHKDTSTAAESHRSSSGGISGGVSDGNRPLRFVQNEQQSFWGPCKRGNEQGTQVAGHWHVTNTSDRDVVLLHVRLDGHTSTFSNVATEGIEDRLYGSTHPIPAHRMGRISANLFYCPPIASGTKPLVADVIFTDNYENEHRARATFKLVSSSSSEQLLYAKLLIDGWILNFNPGSPNGRKKISFNSDGTIGQGRNKNEFKWQLTRDSILTIYREDGSLQNKFSYDQSTNRFICINDRSAKGIRDQIIYREGSEVSRSIPP